MKLIVKVALTVALLSSILFSMFIIIPSLNVENETLFFGVTCGSAKVTEQKLLVDKVKTYTNLFVVNNGI